MMAGNDDCDNDDNIGVARILSGGALFIAKKVNLISRRLKDRLNIRPNLTRPAQTVPLTLALAGGALRVLRGCTYTFSL